MTDVEYMAANGSPTPLLILAATLAVLYLLRRRKRDTR